MHKSHNKTADWTHATCNCYVTPRTAPTVQAFELALLTGAGLRHGCFGGGEGAIGGGSSSGDGVGEAAMLASSGSGTGASRSGAAAE